MPLTQHALNTQAPHDFSNLVSLLGGFLSASGRPVYTMNIYQLNGYLRALACSPVLRAIEDWQPLVFADESPNYKDMAEQALISNALICLYNYHVDQVLNSSCDLPFDAEYSPDRTKRINAEQWARGFLQGYILCQDIWGQFLDDCQTNSKLTVILPESIYDEIDDIIATVSGVADAEYAAQNGMASDELKLMFNRLPKKIISYGRFGVTLRNMG